MKRYLYVVDVFREFVDRPFFLAIEGCEVKFVNRVAVKGRFIFFNNGVMAIDFDRAMIIRNRKGEDFPVKLFLAFHIFKEFDDSFYGNDYAVSILPVYNVKCYGAALYLVC